MDTWLPPLYSFRWNYLFIPKLQRCNYLSMLGLKGIHVSKRGHMSMFYQNSAHVFLLTQCTLAKVTENRKQYLMEWYSTNLWVLLWNPILIAVVHYADVIMSTITSQITSLTVVYSTVHSGKDKRKYQSSTSLAFVGGIHRWPVNSVHKGQ